MFGRHSQKTELGIAVNEYERFVTVRPPLTAEEISMFETTQLVHRGSLTSADLPEGPTTLVGIPSNAGSAIDYARPFELSLYATRGEKPNFNDQAIYLGYQMLDTVQADL